MKNAITLSALLAIATFSGQAFSGDSIDRDFAKQANTATKSLSRDAVRAEAMASRYTTYAGEKDNGINAVNVSQRTRAEVRAEAVMASHKAAESYEGSAL